MSIEEKMDMLRRKIKAGALGADDARRALRAEIDGELRKAAADVDMDAVNACEALLAELSGAKEETHAAQNLRAIREKLHPQRRAPKRSAAVAALLAAALVFGGTATVLGLAGNDHTKRLEELQENRRDRGRAPTAWRGRRGHRPARGRGAGDRRIDGAGHDRNL